MEEPFTSHRRTTLVFDPPAEGDPDVRRADPDYRRRVLGCIVLAAALGTLALQFGVPLLEEHLRKQTPEEALANIRLILLVLLLPVFPLGVSLVITALKVLLTGSFPAPEARVIRDTTIIRGPAAQRIGALIGVAGLILAVASIAGAFYVPEMLDRTLSGSFTY